MTQWFWRFLVWTDRRKDYTSSSLAKWWCKWLVEVADLGHSTVHLQTHLASWYQAMVKSNLKAWSCFQLAQYMRAGLWNCLYFSPFFVVYFKTMSVLHTTATSRDRAIIIATGHGLDSWGVRVWVLVEAKFSSSPCRPGWFWGPPSPFSNGNWGVLSPVVKQQGRENDYSPP